MMRSKKLLLVCHFLNGEVSRILEMEKIGEWESKPFRGACDRSRLNWEGMEKTLSGARKNYEWIEVLGGICCERFREKFENLKGLRFHSFDQCFYFLLNREIVDSLISGGAYLTSPGWISRWKDHIGAWGFEKQTLRAFMGESVKRLILLDTGVDPGAQSHLQEFADYSGLPYEVMSIGLDHMRLRVLSIMKERELAEEREEFGSRLAYADKKVADYAMAVDLIDKLVRAEGTEDVLAGILDIFRMLFDPKKLEFKPHQEKSGSGGSGEGAFIDSYRMSPSGSGFSVIIEHGMKSLGTIEADEISHPEYMKHYLDIAINISKVCGLALENSRLYREVQDALRVRNDFLSGVSHDLRNPVQTIMNVVYNLRKHILKTDTAGDERLIKGLERIDNNVTRMRKQLDELVDFARVQSGLPLQLVRKPVDLEVLVRELSEEMGLRTTKHAIKVSAPPGRLIGNWDQARLERVLANVLSNCIKYSPEGGEVMMRISRDSKNSQNWAIIEVEDNGIGIPQEDLPAVFDRFHRGRNVVERFSGTGIGLFVVKQIIEQHGGKVEIASDEGRGTTVSLHLPLK